MKVLLLVTLKFLDYIFLKGRDGGASPMAQQVKNLPAMQETKEMQFQYLVREDPLEEEMATHLILLPEKAHG